MKQRTRIIIAVALVVIVVGLVLTVDMIQRRQSVVPEPGSIPVYVKGTLAGYMTPSHLSSLEISSFVDAEEGKTQEGWLLHEALIQVIPLSSLSSETVITISSSSRDKSVTLTWADVADPLNRVLFDLSSRGTFKIVSEKLPNLDVRAEWVQDVDKIEVR
jgi:hypothetical protein